MKVSVLTAEHAQNLTGKSVTRHCSRALRLMLSANRRAWVEYFQSVVASICLAYGTSSWSPLVVDKSVADRSGALARKGSC